jgi:hypothetical protein
VVLVSTCGASCRVYVTGYRHAASCCGCDIAIWRCTVSTLVVLTGVSFQVSISELKPFNISDIGFIVIDHLFNSFNIARNYFTTTCKIMYIIIVSKSHRRCSQVHAGTLPMLGNLLVCWFSVGWGAFFGDRSGCI